MLNLSYHNIGSYKLQNFMTDRSIACLPVWVCGCPDGCGAGNKTSASKIELDPNKVTYIQKG